MLIVFHACLLVFVGQKFGSGFQKIDFLIFKDQFLRFLQVPINIQCHLLSLPFKPWFLMHPPRSLGRGEREKIWFWNLVYWGRVTLCNSYQISKYIFFMHFIYIFIIMSPLFITSLGIIGCFFTIWMHSPETVSPTLLQNLVNTQSYCDWVCTLGTA